jgi:tRNA-Thr(GGU) m(6)t(6)A37 methyltransferase TsaA
MLQDDSTTNTSQGLTKAPSQMGVNLQVIGVVHSCYPDKFGTPRQAGLIPEAAARIELFPHVQPELSLDGLKSFSHLWVIFCFHKNGEVRFHAKVHPPRLEGKTMGLFATRTPHRPNPIGLSLVEIVSVDNTGVTVRGVDLIDGTPVLDIKPYLPEVESKPEALSGWLETIENRSILVEWAESSLMPKNPEFKSLIEKTIQLDPRPIVYRDEVLGESKYRESHAVRIHDLDVHFRFTSHDRAEIIAVKNATSS